MEDWPPCWTKFFISRSMETRVPSSHFGASKRSAASSSPEVALRACKISTISGFRKIVSRDQATKRCVSEGRVTRKVCVPFEALEFEFPPVFDKAMLKFPP